MPAGQLHAVVPRRLRRGRWAVPGTELSSVPAGCARVPWRLQPNVCSGEFCPPEGVAAWLSQTHHNCSTSATQFTWDMATGGGGVGGRS